MVTEEIDRLASMVESFNPKLALVIDRISDSIDVEAGVFEDVKNKAKEWGSKIKDFIKNKRGDLVKALSGALKTVINKVLVKSGVALKLAKVIVTNSSVDPLVKSEVMAAISEKDIVVVVKRLSALLKKQKVTPDAETEAASIAKGLVTQLKTASERDFNAIVSSMVEAGAFSKISVPAVLIIVLIMVLLSGFFTAAGATEATGFVLNSFSHLVTTVAGEESTQSLVKAVFEQKLGPSGEILKYVLHVMAANDSTVLKDVLIQGNSPENVVHMLNMSLKDSPDILKEVVTKLALC